MDDDVRVTDEGGVVTLVMVDQHAADERCRVERFLEQLCGKVARGEQVELWAFEKPCAVLVSRQEAVELEVRLEDFARWGLGIELVSREDLPVLPPAPSTSQDERLPRPSDSASHPPADYVQIYLTTVPLLVSGRLRVEPRLQQELVRSYLAQLADEGCSRTTGGRKKGEEGERTWGSVLRQCPPVLLDLVNSKACRGAIMFNDGPHAVWFFFPEACLIPVSLRRAERDPERDAPRPSRRNAVPLPVRPRSTVDDADRQPRWHLFFDDKRKQESRLWSGPDED
jgi:hypothetical protein